MASLILNDLSLNGQFRDSESFWAELELLLKSHSRLEENKNEFLCSADFRSRPATGQTTVLEIVHSVSATPKYLALRWLTKGPFWDASRQAVPIDMFEYNAIDVTEQGLGETARRILNKDQAFSFSFPGIDEFEKTPLPIQHLQENGVIGEIPVENFWQIDLATEKIGVGGERGKWLGLLTRLRDSYKDILFDLDTVAKQLRPYPFDLGLAERISQLLSVLNKVAAAKRLYGDGSPQLTELLNLHFIGRRAQFSDESDQNKVAFRNDLTFDDPEDATNKLFCGWHGKIRMELPYRIHFEWPMPLGQARVKIVYIGPKITRG